MLNDRLRTLYCRAVLATSRLLFILCKNYVIFLKKSVIILQRIILGDANSLFIIIIIIIIIIQPMSCKVQGRWQAENWPF